MKCDGPASRCSEGPLMMFRKKNGNETDEFYGLTWCDKRNVIERRAYMATRRGGKAQSDSSSSETGLEHWIWQTDDWGSLASTPQIKNVNYLTWYTHGMEFRGFRKCPICDVSFSFFFTFPDTGQV